MKLFRILKAHLPAGAGSSATPRFVLPAVTAAGLTLRDARLAEFPAADPDPATGRPRVRVSYLFDVQPDPTDPAFVVCQVAEAVVRAPDEASAHHVIWVE